MQFNFIIKTLVEMPLWLLITIFMLLSFYYPIFYEKVCGFCPSHKVKLLPYFSILLVIVTVIQDINYTRILFIACLIAYLFTLIITYFLHIFAKIPDNTKKYKKNTTYE